MSAQKEHEQAPELFSGELCSRCPSTGHPLDGTSQAYAFTRLSASLKDGPLQ